MLMDALFQPELDGGKKILQSMRIPGAKRLFLA
jgi:hypothetical protein